MKELEAIKQHIQELHERLSLLEGKAGVNKILKPRTSRKDRAGLRQGVKPVIKKLTFGDTDNGKLASDITKSDS